LFITNCAFSQVGIGTTSPDASSSLDISSTNSGLLIPRVNLVSIVDTSTITAPTTSLLVYNTNTAISFGYGVGYYYWNGTQWEKLQTQADDFWSRSPTGDLFPKTINDNVGINTFSPTSKLNVNGQVTIDQKNFGGYGGLLIKGDAPGNNYPNIAFSILNTNGDDKVAGYIGGNINDNTAGSEAMDLSFQTSTNGLFGLSEKMRIKDNGNIGIGTITPTEKLDIAGKIKITDGSEGVGKVLVSNAIGVGSWVTTNSIKTAVSGVFIGGGANIGAGTSVGGGGSSALYCQTYIDLPPGRWMVFGTYLLLSDQFSASIPPLITGESVWVRCLFSSNDLVYTATSDVISGGLISGVLSGPNEFGLANGQTIIENPNPPGGAIKRYYMWASVEKYGTTPTNFFVTAIGGSWGENQLTAIPMN
jgi:hypothetical protein